MDIKEHVSARVLTTFKTGGPLRFVLTLSDEHELPEALAFAKEKSLPLIPIGSGSNMLIPEEGVEAVFVRLDFNAMSSIVKGDSVLLVADAGVIWDEMVSHSVVNGWWGIENLSAIPGTVGAAVVQNIGAYGSAFSECVFSVEVFDTHTGEKKTLTREECSFGYRSSIFKKEVDRYIVVRVTLALSLSEQSNLTYRDLARTFEHTSNPTLAEVRNAVISIRAGKFPPLNLFGTAGSFFLNPILENSVTETLAKRYPAMPLFPLPEGGVKIPLAWILDRVLSLKGMRSGKAFLWEQQPLVITAESGASSDDVVALAHDVAKKVFDTTGITITPEVRMFGAEKKILS